MRKHYPLRLLLRQIIAPCLLAAPLLLNAQVSLYNYSESVGTYTEITDGVLSLGRPTYWPQVYNQLAWVNNPFNDPDGQSTPSAANAATGPGYPIGFNFTFNGDVFDVIGISNGGWISFGKSSDNLQAVWVYNVNGYDPFLQPGSGPQPSYKRNRVAGFGNSGLQQVNWTSLDPPGAYSQVQMATIGTAPNRVCVVQWKDYGLRGDITVAMNKINFQIRLNERDNSVEVVFGPMDWVSALNRSRGTQIGLSGRANTDYNGRMTKYEQPAFIYDWNTTVRATSNIATDSTSCWFAPPQPGQPNGSGIPPVLGRTFKWTPPACPPPVWPLTVGEITFRSAVAKWEATPAGEYEYFVSTANSVSGPEVASGTTTDLQAVIEGLSPLTTYYVFARSICDGVPGPWPPLGVSFRTLGGGIVECNGSTVDVDYCSHTYDTVDWLYTSSDGSPLKIEFQGGYVGSAGSESFQIWYGGSPAGTPDFKAHASSDMAGQSFVSTNGQFYIRLVTDAGACEAQPWYTPFKWRVGCKNCTDPLMQYNVGEVNCAAQQYYVDANVFLLGSSSTLVLKNSLGVPPTTVSASGTYAVGPFPAGTPVVVTAQNPDNAMCYTASASLINQPCALVDCGPTTYTHCYDNNEFRQWAYQGADGQEIGIRFRRGSVGLGDHLYSYNGLNVDDLVATEVAGYLVPLTNKLITSGAPSTDHALVMELQANGSVSCATEDPDYGSAEEWEYVVACYDGCTQPKATFTTECLNRTQFEVAVNVTDLGSTGSVTITNDGGAAEVTATATGTYKVGPIPSGTPVTVEVKGASVLCSWTSPVQKLDCSTIGIDEAVAGLVRLYPNPSDGRFMLELPQGMTGTMHLQVQDLTGRVVSQQRVSGTGRVSVELSELPNGLYTVVLRNNERTATGRISIQH
ncbi:MAG: T9SS type A sorting domain-containing protein [Flavobacteriales bacterium]